MRTLNYYIASTLDGFIAREDGSFDDFYIFGDGPHVTDYMDSLQTFDIALMGRKTYEVGLRQGVTNPYPHMKTYVVTRTMTTSPDAQVELIASDVIARVEQWKAGAGKGIYLCGGADLASMLFDHGLIDQVTVKLFPMMLGSGISLAHAISRRVVLERTDIKPYDSGVVYLYYRVKK